VRVNPVNKVAGLGVHSGVAGLSTSVSPADNSVKTKSTHEGAARVSLAGVLATSIKTSTDHGVSDVILTIGVTAVIIRDNRDIDLHQGSGQAASLGGGSPSRDGAHVAGGIFLTRGGNGDGVNNRAAQVSGAIKVEHADIIGDGP